MTASLARSWSGPPGGTRVALLHGFTQSAATWNQVAAGLTQQGCRTVSVDLPGHGLSAAVRADLDTTAELVAWAAGRAVYVGYSLGGRVALHLALARPELVTGVVLLGATAGIDDTAERHRRRDEDEALARSLERSGLDAFLRQWLQRDLFRGVDAEAERASRRGGDAAALAGTLRLMGTGVQRPLWSVLGRIRVPALLIVGEHDAKFRALAERLAGELGGPVDLLVVPGAHHAVVLEEPGLVTEALLAWMRDHGGQPAGP